MHTIPLCLNPECHVRSVEVLFPFQTVRLSEQDHSLWRGSVDLELGTYQYRFIIDGALSLPDPQNNMFNMDENGIIWSVMVIDENGQQLYHDVQPTVYIAQCSLSLHDQRVGYQAYHQKHHKITLRLKMEKMVGMFCVTAAWYTPMGVLQEYSNVLVEPDESGEASALFWIDKNNISLNGQWKCVLFFNGSRCLEESFAVNFVSQAQCKALSII